MRFPGRIGEVKGVRLFCCLFGPHSEVLRINLWFYTQESLLEGSEGLYGVLRLNWD